MCLFLEVLLSASWFIAICYPPENSLLELMYFIQRKILIIRFSMLFLDHDDAFDLIRSRKRLNIVDLSWRSSSKYSNSSIYTSNWFHTNGTMKMCLKHFILCKVLRSLQLFHYQFKITLVRWIFCSRNPFLHSTEQYKLLISVD